ncbi:hypothetical protein ABPG72_013798 [Tetrahymena utriculariae]
MSCCLLNICCVLPQKRPHFCTKRKPQNDLLQSNLYQQTNNWLSQINDETYVSNINIPGTHESMALHSYFTLSIPVCQKWLLKDQLESGIRFLDIRIKENRNGRLPIHHDIVFQKAYFEEDVLNVCEQFLAQNPTEFVIIMIRIEQRDNNAPPLSSRFDQIVQQRKPNLFSFESSIPKIKEIRGKIWIWNGNNWNYKGFSIYNMQKTGVLVRQDDYDCPIKQKKKLIKDTHDLAIQFHQNRKNGTEIYLNQTNGSQWNDWPSSYAEEINKYVYENQFYEGILAIDFPGESLIKEIIETNFNKPTKYDYITSLIKLLRSVIQKRNRWRFSRIRNRQLLTD